MSLQWLAESCCCQCDLPPSRPHLGGLLLQLAGGALRCLVGSTLCGPRLLHSLLGCQQAPRQLPILPFQLGRAGSA